MNRIRELPGVAAVSAAVGAPLYAAHWFGELRPDQTGATMARATRYSLQAVGPSYFATLAVPMLAGREFTPNDQDSGSPGEHFDVVVVNKALADRFWPGENALGRRLVLNGTDAATVVGVVDNIVDVSATGAVPRAYFPLLESDFTDFDVIVRASGSAASEVGQLRDALMTIPTIIRPSVRTIESVVSDASLLSRSAVVGLSVCAAVALCLTGIGIYGVASMWTLQRRREIGIRMAIGARPHQVSMFVVSEIAKLTAAGGILGGLCGLGLVQVERASVGPLLSVQISPMILAFLGLAGLVGLAVFVPTQRALRTPVAAVLRES